ncbi:MAG: GGDEF domain-containing protein [Desulfobacterium sp.]|nr:GGDEF domain-containing protein [Desulfobacterium sp.]
MLKVFRSSIAFVIVLILGCQSLLLLLPDGHWGPFLTLATICSTLVLAGLLYRCSGYQERERPEQSKGSRDVLEEKEIPWSVFRKVVENMPIMFDAVDENGVVLFWNKECERITGYTSEEIVGNPNALELFYPDPVQRAKNVEAFLEFNGSYRDWDVDLLCKNGETRTISWSNTSSTAPIPGWYTWGIGTDITKRKKAEQRLTEHATRDELTGLFNRRKIMAVLEMEMDRAARYSDPLTLCLVDIDNFKAVNDVHGHNAGDIVLERVADAIGKGIRKTDSVGRYGGEEFCIVLPHTSMSQSRLLLERIRQTISSMTFLLDSGIGISLTISLGQAQYDPSIKETRQLINSADTALYQAKQSGRNRLCTSDQDL